MKKAHSSPICWFWEVTNACLITSVRYAFLNDRGQQHSTATGHELTHLGCLLEPRERGRARVMQAGSLLTSTISVLEYLVSPCSAGWMTETCTRVFSFRSRTGATRSLHAGNSRAKRKETDTVSQGKLQSWVEVSGGTVLNELSGVWG